MSQRMSLRIIILIIFLIVGLTIFNLLKSLTQKNSEKMNLILISVDTLRADHMGVYGYPKGNTPNIDKWAKDALVFTNMRTVVPVTLPSFSILMTGESPFKNKIYSNGVVNGNLDTRIPRISDNTMTLAEILKKNGYSTSAFVSNVALHPPYTNLNRGFDTYNNIEYSKGREEYESTILNSLNWLDENKKNNFFLWVHFLDPHAPYLPSNEFLCKFNDQYCSYIQEKGAKGVDGARYYYEGCEDIPVPKRDLDIIKTLYDGSIASADVLIGKILSKIEQLGLDKNSIVVFYGDHGEGFDHNYYFKHGEVLYDSSIRIPLVIKYPPASIKTNSVDHYMENTQIFPSLLDLLNINNVNTDGSFKDYFYKDVISDSNSVKKYRYYVNSALNQYAIEDGKYKLIYSMKGGSCVFLEEEVEELYDLKNDPNELKNIINENIDIASRLRKELRSYIIKYPLKSTLVDDEPSQSPSPEIQKTIEKLKSLGY